MKRMAIALILALLALLLLPSAASAAGIEIVGRSGDGVWIDDTWKVEIYPGERKATTISLRNSSSSSLGVEVNISPNSLDNGNLTFELDKTDFTMPSRSYTDVTMSVTANGSATPGTYTAELKIKSEYMSVGDGGGTTISKLRIYDLAVQDVTDDSADIYWRTNRKSNSKVVYWASSEVTVKDGNYVWEHLIHLDNLAPDTTYHFEVASKDKYWLLGKYWRIADDEDKFTTLEEEAGEVVIEPTPPSPPVPPMVEPAQPAPAPPGPPDAVPPETPWGLISGVIGGIAVVVGGITYWLRRKKKENGRVPG